MITPTLRVVGCSSVHATTAHAQRGASNVVATEVYEATATGLQAAMSAGRTTSVAITKAYLAHIAAYDQAAPMLTAIVRRNPNELREAAALRIQLLSKRHRSTLRSHPGSSRTSL